jgi:MGT family glycosyltransferase
VVKHIWWARAFGPELLAAVERTRPDALLVDVNLTYAVVAARSTGLPTTTLCHFPYQVILGPFVGVTTSLLPATNAYAAELGLAPFASHQALLEASTMLVASYRAFDEVEAPAPTVVHVGPMRTAAGTGSTWRRTTDRPLVLVGLSTSHQNQVPLLQRLCDALGVLDVEVLVTTGPSIAPELLRPASNTTVLPFVAHDEVLPSADLLVTHAGHGTVMAGVAHGVPMLCLPMGRDQPLIADRAARLGVGAVASCEASVAQLRDAIVALLADAGARHRARAFAESLRDHPGLDHAVGLVENC